MQSQKTPSLHTVKVRDFFARASDVVTVVDDSRVFLPDNSWSKTFAEGLEKKDFADRSVLEVGVGSGINMAGLLTTATPPRSFTGLDIAQHAIFASARLAMRESFDADLRRSDLLGAVYGWELAEVQDIIACIPQVPRHADEIDDERDFSDYYEETGIREDKYGLGLIARLLDQVRERAPHAELTLNIAGRPGVDRVNDLYESRGFQKEIIHAAIVQQEPTTSLASLAEIERDTGLPFHFYESATGGREISATKAEALRVKNVPIYHDLYVIQAKLG